MADELDPKDPNEEFGRTNPEDITGTADEEEEDSKTSTRRKATKTTWSPEIDASHRVTDD